jgi:hypothetical protein
MPLVTWPFTVGSVEAFQLKLMDVVVLEGLDKPVGTLGGVTSGVGGDGLLIVTATVASVVLPAASLAVALRV